MECAQLFPEAYHTSHPKHPLKFLTCGVPSYAEKKCLLCGRDIYNIHHCDICNFSVCTMCATRPPPLVVVSKKTHEHQLHLVPRKVDFTCNACGTLGDRSPYFCLQCNFMIHRACIDLPRIININRHDHRISYTSHLGHGNWKCGVCRKDVDGFYGAYLCSKCPRYAVHSTCATRFDVWDNIELEGTPEEEEDTVAFEVIDEKTIKYFSHDHHLVLNKNGGILQESRFCEACVFQIKTDPFYACEECDFILHETCANLPRKKRHVSHNIPFTLHTDGSGNSPRQRAMCTLCRQDFTGFRYKSGLHTLDVRCGSISEPFTHDSHPHSLYYKYGMHKRCDACDKGSWHMLYCDDCPFTMDFKCAFLPKKVFNQRYDDHPLVLSYGDTNVDGEYWCDVCETKVDPRKWFYTCDPCGITLHISCVVGDFSNHMPGPVASYDGSHIQVVSNSCICRPHCFRCRSRCIVPFILKISEACVDVYFCSKNCFILRAPTTRVSNS